MVGVPTLCFLHQATVLTSSVSTGDRSGVALPARRGLRSVPRWEGFLLSLEAHRSPHLPGKAVPRERPQIPGSPVTGAFKKAGEHGSTKGKGRLQGALSSSCFPGVGMLQKLQYFYFLGDFSWASLFSNRMNGFLHS